MDETQRLIRQYAPKGIIVDTNVLLLYFVGTLSRQRISQFKRTDQFSETDYDLLTKRLVNFRSVVATPNILTEVSSLINQLGEPERSACYRIFASKIDSLQEFYLPSREVASLDWPFWKYGLTDCGIAVLAQGQYLVLTDDLKAAIYLYGRGIDTINFNNLRAEQR